MNKYTVRILMSLLFLLPIVVLFLAYLSLKRPQQTYSEPKPVPLPYQDMSLPNNGKE